MIGADRRAPHPDAPIHSIAEKLEALTAGFVAGDYRAAPITDTCGLGEAQEAYRKVAAGSAGRAVLRLQE